MFLLMFLALLLMFFLMLLMMLLMLFLMNFLLMPLYISSDADDAAYVASDSVTAAPSMAGVAAAAVVTDAADVVVPFAADCWYLCPIPGS